MDQPSGGYLGAVDNGTSGRSLGVELPCDLGGK